jgi:DNA polymerase III alpha subunit
MCSNRHSAGAFNKSCKVFRTSRKGRSKFRATYQRTTKKGEKMAWLTLADGTGAIECAVFPNAYERLAETSQAQSSLREGAFVVARGRVAQQEATGSKLFIDEVQILGGAVTQLSALAVAIAEQQPDEWSALGR